MPTLETHPSIRHIAKKTGLSEYTIFCLLRYSGTLDQVDEEDEEENEPTENFEEIKAVLDLLIPDLEYSTLIYEFSSLLDIYKSDTTFETNDIKGSWTEVDKGLQNTVIMRSGEAVNYLFYVIGQEFVGQLKRAMNQKYGNYAPKEVVNNAPQEDNP